MPRRNAGPRLRFLEKRQTWYICWTDRGRSCERSTGTADLGEAQVALGEFLRQQPGRSGPRDPSEKLITDLLGDYADAQADRVRDPVRLANAVDALTPFWTARTVQDITRQTCAAYRQSRGRYFVVWREAGAAGSRCAFTSDRTAAEAVLAGLKASFLADRRAVDGLTLQFRPLSAGTIRRELTVLRAAINGAHREGHLTRSVVVHLPEPPPPRERFLTRDELARLLRAARNEPRSRMHLPLFILMGAYTGRRKEALLSLRWPAVDLRAGGLIDFRRPGEAETKKRRGRVQIPRRLAVHLRNARRRGTDLGHVINDGGQSIKDIKRSFQSACDQAGLVDVTPHTLRHTCATWLMRKGVDKWKAAGFLAMSLDTLERVYGHHHPDHDGGAGEAFSNRPRNVRASTDSNGLETLPLARKTSRNQ
jgi:integrase